MRTPLTPGKPRQWRKTVAATGTPEVASKRSFAGVTIDEFSSVQNEIELALGTSDHDFQLGDKVLLSGTTNFNEWGLITAIQGTGIVVRFAEGVADSGAGSEGPITVGLEVSIPFRAATVIGRTSQSADNTGRCWLGLLSTNGSQLLPVDPDARDVLQAPAPDTALNLRDFYIDVEVAGEGLTFWLFE